MPIIAPHRLLGGEALARDAPVLTRENGPHKAIQSLSYGCTVKTLRLEVRSLRGALVEVASAVTSRRVERDVKAVHGDVHAALSAGVLSKTSEGQVSFQYDEIHVDYVIRREPE